jgi:PKD repeat protein
MSQDIELTIPLTNGTSGAVTIWKFIPDDQSTADGELIALPAVGHWRFFTTGTAVSNKVIFSSDSFGQFMVTTTTGGGGGGGENEPPVAALSASPAAGAAPLTVEFNAGGSTDDVGIVRYQWDWNGDGTYEEEGTTPTISHEFTEGVYDVVVQVTDDEGLTDTATIQISAGNEPPSVTGVTPTEAVAGTPVTLTAAATDNDGTIANYAWDFDGGEDFEVDGAAVNTIEHTFTAAGTANIRVRVRDDAGAETIFPATITVTEAVSGDPRITDLQPRAAEAGVEETFELTATDDGSIAKYEWDWDNDGTYDFTSTTENTAAHSFAAEGDATIKVQVTDDEDNVASQTFVIAVGPPIVGEPSVTLSAEPEGGELVDGTLEVTLSAALFPPGIVPTSVEYQFEAGGGFFVEDDATPLEAVAVYAEPGEYVATVRVNRDGEAPLMDSVTITVTAPAEPNELPAASFTWFQDPENPLRIIFDGNGSSDSDGTIAAWSWDFDDDDVEDATGATTAHAFGSAGDYPVTLKVTDNGGGENEITITVSAANP